MVEYVRHCLNHEHVEILPMDISDQNANLKPHIAYVHLTHVEPFRGSPFKQQSININNNKEWNEKEDLDPMAYQLHTNIKTFVYEERIIDEKAPTNAPEQARLAVKRIVLTGMFLEVFKKKIFIGTVVGKQK